MGRFRFPNSFNKKPYPLPTCRPRARAAFYTPLHRPEVEIKSHNEVQISVGENQKSVPCVTTTYLSKVQVVQTLGGARIKVPENRNEWQCSSRSICLCGNSSCTGSHIYWLSCNHCGLRFSPFEQTQMILVSCGCIFCRRCASSRSKDYCQICLESTGEIEENINSDLPDDSKEMFDTINYPSKMMSTRNNFRDKHFNRYMEFLTVLERRLEKKLQEMEKEASDDRTMLRKLESQIREKEKKVARLEELYARQQLY